jgi:hypothetical protein
VTNSLAYQAQQNGIQKRVAKPGHIRNRQIPASHHESTTSPSTAALTTFSSFKPRNPSLNNRTKMQPTTTVLLLSLLSLTVSQNAQAPDGPIVPFTSVLPACASNCGPLYDVQGKCAPPNIAAVDPNCFCTDTRLTPFDNSGTSGVSQVCVGAGSCTAPADLQAIKSWYDSYCAGHKGASPTTGGSSSPTSTNKSSSGSKSAGNTW